MEGRMQIAGVSGHLDQPLHDRFGLLAVNKDMGIERVGAGNACGDLAFCMLHNSQSADLHVVMLDVSEELGHQAKRDSRKCVGKTARGVIVMMTGGALKREARPSRQIGP